MSRTRPCGALAHRSVVSCSGLGATEVFGGLADLPVAIFERAVDGGLDVVTLERCKGEDGTTTYRRLVGARDDDRRYRPLVADRSE